MKRLNNYKEADIEEGGKEVTSVMGQKKKKEQIGRVRQEVPTETDMSHTSEPDTQKATITFLFLCLPLPFSYYIFLLFDLCSLLLFSFQLKA